VAVEVADGLDDADGRVGGGVDQDLDARLLHVLASGADEADRRVDRLQLPGEVAPVDVARSLGRDNEDRRHFQRCARISFRMVPAAFMARTPCSPGTTGSRPCSTLSRKLWSSRASGSFSSSFTSVME